MAGSQGCAAAPASLTLSCMTSTNGFDTSGLLCRHVVFSLCCAFVIVRQCRDASVRDWQSRLQVKYKRFEDCSRADDCGVAEISGVTWPLLGSWNALNQSFTTVAIVAAADRAIEASINAVEAVMHQHGIKVYSDLKRLRHCRQQVPGACLGKTLPKRPWAVLRI